MTKGLGKGNSAGFLDMLEQRNRANYIQQYMKDNNLPQAAKIFNNTPEAEKQEKTEEAPLSSRTKKKKNKK